MNSLLQNYLFYSFIANKKIEFLDPNLQSEFFHLSMDYGMVLKQNTEKDIVENTYF